MREFENIFSINDSIRILDVGGNQFNWQFINQKPKITIVNIEKPNDWVNNSQFEFVIGDATKLNFADKSFDIVYSNSVIEHLFTKENQLKMANEVQRVGKKSIFKHQQKNFLLNLIL